MAKRRKEHDGCLLEIPKRSKLLDESVTSETETILYVPDTPLDRIKQRPRTQKDQILLNEKLDVSEKSDEDEFSDSDIDIGDLDVDNIQSVYSNFSRYVRYQVLDVTDDGNKKMIHCKNASTRDATTSITLTGEWYYCDILPGNFLHIIQVGPHSDEIKITNENSNMMIIHPDILVSPTTISSSVRCARQAVLGEVFKPTVGYSSNEVMLLGTINHALFDVAVRSQLFDPVFLRKQLMLILEQDNIIDSLSCMESDKEEMLKKLIPSIDLISQWGKKFCKGSGDVVSYGQKGDEVTKINQILDIEENIWSPKYGCKGKVDATVRIHAQSKTKISPVEVKSGSSRNSLGSVDHRAQVILYTMMLEERYKDSVDSGILYYIKGKQTIGVPSSAMERRALIVKRNEIASALQSILYREEMKLPELVNDKMTCKWCNHQLTCSLAFRSFEKKDPANHPYPEILENNTSTLSQAHIEYFAKFSKLCIQEAQTSTQSARMPWDESCKKYGKLTLNSVSEKHGFYHEFHFQISIKIRSCFLRLGDYIIISKEDGSAYNLCSGFITDLTESSVEVYSSDTNIERSAHHRPGPAYCITPHQSLSSLHTSLGNVTSFMSPEPRAEKWRKLIVDGNAPSFSTAPFSFTQEARLSAEHSSDALLMSLNSDQRRAVEKAVATEDYLCILGMPGTGKTSTISYLVQLLVARGHSVLLTAYTHSAVDNLVLKLPQSVDLVRLGAPGRIHPGNKSRSSQALTAHIRDPKLLRNFYNEKGTLYHCTACGRLFKTEVELNTHQCGRTRGVSGKEKVHKCHICEKMFAERGNLTKHIRTVHNKEARLSCPYCKYRTDHEPNLTVHIATHTGDKKYKCTQCDYTAFRKCHLTSHIYRHHTNKTYRCRYQQCEVKKPTQEELYEHIRTEHPVQRYVCESCPMSFRESKELWQHKRTHSIGQYKCKYCGKLFSRAAHLDQHSVTHTGERRHFCSVCNKGFTQSAHLTQHMVKHTGEKPYSCTFCDKKFTRNGSRTTHEITCQRRG